MAAALSEPAFHTRDVHSRIVDRGLDDQGVAAQAQAALLGEVTVDDRIVEVIERANQLRTLDLTEIEVLQLGDGVDIDVTVTLRDGHEALRGQELERTRLVGGVRNDADRAAIGQLVERLVLLEKMPSGSRWMPAPASNRSRPASPAFSR